LWLFVTANGALQSPLRQYLNRRPRVLDATADVLDENDVAAPFIEQRLVEDPEAVTPPIEMRDAVQKWLGRMMADAEVDRIMDGIKSRWNTGRKRVGGKQIRGFLGVRLLTS
jgi:hypothetical protein